MKRRLARIGIAVLLNLVAVRALASAQSKPGPLLDYSYSGSGKPGASGREFMAAMAHLEVQRVLLDIAAQPRDRSWVQETLKAADVKPELLQEATPQFFVRSVAATRREAGA
ncbi:MAG: hypothetical protein ACE15E_23190, partial [Acidobacteriota bacterium]